MKTNTTLTALADLLREEGIDARLVRCPQGGDEGVCGVDCDSRRAGAGRLFVCKGAAFRPSYLADALAAGCGAYLCAESRAVELAVVAPDACALVVPDKELRRAMALVSAEAWGHPERHLRIIGVTGTKGKSTCTYMIRSILDAGATDGRARAAILGSIETFDGVERFESVNTTPEAPDLWRHLANAVAAGLPYLVMEVSSQALKYERVVGLDLSVGCFLNIGRDHISPAEHPSFEDYFNSKLRIFDQSRAAVVNLDMDHAAKVERAARAAAACERVTRFSAGTHTAPGFAEVWARDVTSTGDGLRFVAHTPRWERELTLPMPGSFNVENALCAIAACEGVGVGPDQIARGLARAVVPGRMELLPTADPRVTGIVDYAHNKLSYQRFFASMSKEFAGRAIIAVLGAPGGKAFERRVELPREAARWADHLIYTEEDPACEDVASICAQLSQATPPDTPHDIVLDREAAIRRAVDLAFSSPTGALVCLLAKGDETLQHKGDAFVPCETDATLFRRAVADHLAASS
ncbi:Mur ligase family protein [Olsenella sp. HMSC062G07]|uniref:Mur ligase family protein n=1 Tax=Olsenella sp. HMSC062G07 TaxID=1739330 RepID=UPI0008A487DA|nr:UDP-N-acetylmuramoyl-L-alanyl-D-glutamate--2,6-diaminopimelate ligase [Olsenella sp. HMSC062G07]OFK22150.1 UDP-N-acetylmuramyl peptide synthase [Olsenella sp. HMSC062G07]